MADVCWRCVNVREPSTCKELDVDSNKDMDVGLQLLSPVSPVYVCCAEKWNRNWKFRRTAGLSGVWLWMSVVMSLHFTWGVAEAKCTLCFQKNVPPLACYNFGINILIAKIFWQNCCQESKKSDVFSPHLNCLVLNIILRKRKPRRQRTGALCVQHSPTAAALLTFLAPCGLRGRK